MKGNRDIISRSAQGTDWERSEHDAEAVSPRAVHAYDHDIFLSAYIYKSGTDG
jgi:hypothetical protein